VAAALITSHNLIMMDIIHQNCTSSGQGIPGPTPGARPGGGAIRASGGRLLPPRGTTGLSPKKPRGSNDGPANCLVGDEEAQGQHGTEKDQKQIRPRHGTLDIGFWNIRSLRGKEPELVEEVSKYHLDIVGISETRLRGNGSRDLDLGWKLFYSGSFLFILQFRLKREWGFSRAQGCLNT
jgi:hypothetical protein